MRRLRRPARVAAALVGLALVVTLALLLLPGDIEARYTVRLDHEAGLAHVDLALSGLRHPVLPLALMGGGWGEVEVVAFDGTELPWLAGVRLLWPLTRDQLDLSYTLRFGLKGRHGQQGRVAADWALLQTRLLLWAPAPPWAIGDVQVRVVDLQPGHQTLIPWPDAGEGWHRAEVEGAPLTDVLLKSAIAVGEFEMHSIRLGDSDVEIATHASFTAEDRDLTRARAAAVLADMHALLGFELRTRYLHVFVPSSPEAPKVFGSSWTLGHCYEMVPRHLRQWQLFAHRVAHVFNRDRPYGLRFARAEDQWLKEALATWMETSVTRASGVAASDGAFGGLFHGYWRRRADDPERWDWPPALDADVADHEVIEWLHYTKYPLVLTQLHAELVAAGVTGGVRALFVRLFKTYGGHAAPVPSVRAEAEALCGCDLDRFFRRYVHGRWPVLPLWDAALARARTRAGRGQGVGLSEAEAADVAALAERGLGDVPAALAGVAGGLSDHQRAAVAEFRRRLASHLEPK